VQNSRAPTILLCDAAFSALPILFALKDNGYRVAVCGARPNDPGHALADVSFVIDYSDEDLLRQTVRRNGIRYIVPGCTDTSYASCSRVAHELGLPGYDSPDVTAIIHRKDAFRNFCADRNFPIPAFVAHTSDVSRLRFPILVKPSDSFSGKGIIKVDRKPDLHAAIEASCAYSATRSIILEEFISGQLYSHSAFIRNGHVWRDFFVNEYCTVHPYQVNSSHVSVEVSVALVDRMRGWLEQFARDLSLADGLVHTQFIATDNAFYLIEVTRRCPGDLYARLIEKSLGVDYAALFASAFCHAEERAGSSKRKPEASRFYSRHTVSVEEDCIFLSSSCSLPSAAFVPLKRTGEILRAAPMDRAGIYFVEHSSAAAMKELTPRLRDFVRVQSKPHV